MKKRSDAGQIRDGWLGLLILSASRAYLSEDMRTIGFRSGRTRTARQSCSATTCAYAAGPSPLG